MINRLLKKEEAEALFEKEAVMMVDRNGVPYYRVIDLFGEQAARFIVRHQSPDGWLQTGRDCSAFGECSAERPLINYLHKSGFIKVVSEHNYLLLCKEQQNSDGQKLFDRCFEEDFKYLDDSEGKKI